MKNVYNVYVDGVLHLEVDTLEDATKYKNQVKELNKLRYVEIKSEKKDITWSILEG